MESFINSLEYSTNWYNALVNVKKSIQTKDVDLHSGISFSDFKDSIFTDKKDLNNDKTLQSDDLSIFDKSNGSGNSTTSENTGKDTSTGISIITSSKASTKDDAESPKMPETAEEWAEYGCTSPSKIQAFLNMEPKFQEDVIDLMDYMKEQGWTVYVEKAKTGGTSKGKLGGSNHNMGVAIDIHFCNAEGKRSLAGYKQAGEYWTSKGEEYRWLGADDRDGAPYEEWHFDIHKDSYYQYLDD